MKVRDALAQLRIMNPELELGTDDGQYLVTQIETSSYDDESGEHEYAAITMEEWEE